MTGATAGDTAYCADACGRVATDERLVAVLAPSVLDPAGCDEIVELVCVDCLRTRP